MTPKEKANELFKKYLYYFPEFYNDKEYDYDTDKAKQCALITVDEILEVILSDEYYCSLIHKYWQEVKQEIEKL